MVVCSPRWMMSPGRRPRRKGSLPPKKRSAPMRTTKPPRKRSVRPSSRRGSIMKSHEPNGSKLKKSHVDEWQWWHIFRDFAAINLDEFKARKEIFNFESGGFRGVRAVGA